MADLSPILDILINPELDLGEFANAFRVLEDEDGGCVLEFLVYSETGKKAKLVRRITVNPALLPRIRDKLTKVLNLIEMTRQSMMFSPN